MCNDFGFVSFYLVVEIEILLQKLFLRASSGLNISYACCLLSLLNLLFLSFCTFCCFFDVFAVRFAVLGLYA